MLKYLGQKSKQNICLESLKDFSTRGILRENYIENPPNSSPISVKKSSWQKLENPERLSRTVTLKDKREVKYLIDKMLDVQQHLNHEITIIVKGQDVTVETYTHGFEGITELDLKVQKMCNELINEILRMQKLNEAYSY